ncbi:hypothetical protein J2Y54_000517 [Sphingomonas sp. BE123]|uniref:hypothetical protein n=1 Tax=Sphingomonas sp. BE123 TaxID=2817842 RepID=UPI00285C3C69|nr:hypothetical protein [Sphingomonas sp. BE123]MDR6851024.1 hypothetical protein [Sphingomonas sp. BE123]
MRQYHRFMYTREDFLASQTSGALEAVLADAPGVRDVEVLGPHPNGGFKVQFELDPASIDLFISYLEETGWRSVM